MTYRPAAAGNVTTVSDPSAPSNAPAATAAPRLSFESLTKNSYLAIRLSKAVSGRCIVRTVNAPSSYVPPRSMTTS